MEELISSVQETRIDHVEYISDNILQMIFQIAGEEGFDLGQTDKIESVLFMAEAIKAAMLDSVDIDHPLLDFAYDMFDDEEFESE